MPVSVQTGGDRELLVLGASGRSGSCGPGCGARGSPTGCSGRRSARCSWLGLGFSILIFIKPPRRFVRLAASRVPRSGKIKIKMCPPIGIRLVRVFTGAQLRRCGHMLSRFVLDGLQVCVLTLLAAVPDIQANDAKVLDYTATSIFFLHFRPFLQPCHPHAPWGNKKKKKCSAKRPYASGAD